MTKAEEIEIPEEDRATNFNKPPIKRYIAKLPGKEEIRGKNPQMKMIGPEVEDAMRRKNYIHLSTRFELLKRGYIIKTEPRPEAEFNVVMFNKADKEYKKWKEANTPKEKKYDIYGKPIKAPRGPFPTRYDLALNLHDPPKFCPDGTPKPPSQYVKEELPQYEYFLVPRRCRKGIIKYFRPQQKIPYSREPLEPRPSSAKENNPPEPAVITAKPEDGSKEPREKGWSQKMRREEKQKISQTAWPKPEVLRPRNV